MLYQKALYMNVVFGLNVVLGLAGGYEKEKINKKEKGETFFLSEGKVDIVLTILPIRMRVLVPSEPC